MGGRRLRTVLRLARLRRRLDRVRVHAAHAAGRLPPCLPLLGIALSAQFTRNPLALATALEKIGGAAAPTRAIKRSCAHLCIDDPLGRRVNASEGRLADLLATHPPLALRSARLKAMGYQGMKRSGPFVPVA